MDELDKQVYNYLHHWLSNRDEAINATDILDKAGLGNMYIAIAYLKEGENNKEIVLKILNYK